MFYVLTLLILYSKGNHRSNKLNGLGFFFWAITFLNSFLGKIYFGKSSIVPGYSYRLGFTHLWNNSRNTNWSLPTLTVINFRSIILILFILKSNHTYSVSVRIKYINKSLFITSKCWDANCVSEFVIYVTKKLYNHKA